MQSPRGVATGAVGRPRLTQKRSNKKLGTASDAPHEGSNTAEDRRAAADLRFYHLRGQLSSALARAERELSQVSTPACYALNARVSRQLTGESDASVGTRATGRRNISKGQALASVR